MYKHGQNGCNERKPLFKSPLDRILGTVTVGERGQIVIPADARAEMDIHSGDRLVVFGNRINKSLILVKADVFDRSAEFILAKSKKLEKIAEDILQATAGVEAVDESEEEAADSDDGAGADNDDDVAVTIEDEA